MYFKCLSLFADYIIAPVGGDKGLSLRVSHWLFHSTSLFKNTDSFWPNATAVCCNIMLKLFGNNSIVFQYFKQKHKKVNDNVTQY